MMKVAKTAARETGWLSDPPHRRGRSPDASNTVAWAASIGFTSRSVIRLALVAERDKRSIKA